MLCLYQNMHGFPSSAQHLSVLQSSSSCSVHSKGNTVMRFHIWLWMPVAGFWLFDFHVILLLRVLPCTGTCALQMDSSLHQVQNIQCVFQKVLKGLVLIYLLLFPHSWKTWKYQAIFKLWHSSLKKTGKLKTSSGNVHI